MKTIYIDYPNTKLGKTLSDMYTFLTYVSIFAVIVGSYYKVSDEYYSYVLLSEFIFSLLFLVDYCIRLIYSKFSRDFVKNPFSIADILSFLPLLIGIGTGIWRHVETLNIFRLFRVLRLFRVGKYFEFLQNLRRSVKGNFYKYQIAFTLFFIIWLVGSFLVYAIEFGKNSMFVTIPDALWRALVTMATVGYGDIYPTTLLGRIIGGCIIIFGPIFLSIITSITIVTFLDVVKHLREHSGIDNGENEYICDNCLSTGHKILDNYCKNCGKKIIK